MRTEHEIVQRVRRGQRVKEIRDGLGLTQSDFATLLQKRMSAEGWQDTYDKPKISRIEQGQREISFDEAIAIVRLDRNGHSLQWLATGKDR